VCAVLVAISKLGTSVEKRIKVADIVMNKAQYPVASTQAWLVFKLAWLSTLHQIIWAKGKNIQLYVAAKSNANSLPTPAASRMTLGCTEFKTIAAILLIAMGIVAPKPGLLCSQQSASIKLPKDQSSADTKADTTSTSKLRANCIITLHKS
jgi:hypothetical protein